MISFILSLVVSFWLLLLSNIGKVLAVGNFKELHPKTGNAYVFYNNHLYAKTRSGHRRGEVEILSKSIERPLKRLFKESYYCCKGMNGVKCKASGKVHPNNPAVFAEIKRLHNHQEDHTEEALAIDALENLRENVKDPVCKRYESYQRSLAK